MPIFIRNLHLEFLTDKGTLISERMVEMYGKARWRLANGGYYPVFTMSSGVEFIFKTIQDGQNPRVVGTDTHYAGRCIWNGLPFMDITPKDADCLSMVLAFTNIAQDGVYIAHMMNAAVLPSIREGQSIAMQMVAFPLSIAVYGSREAYERSATSHTPDAGEPLILLDGKAFPLNFMLKHDPDKPVDKNDSNLKDDIVLLCGSVLSVEKRLHQEPGQDDTGFMVATIATQFGHLDVVFTAQMIGEAACQKGFYIVFSGILSGNVAIEGYENWIDSPALTD